MQTREQAEYDYDVQLGRLVNSLKALASRVEQVGDARRLRAVGLSAPIDRTFLASDVHDLIMGWVGEKNSHLTCLMFAAIAAEHPGGRGTPAEMLDGASSALAAAAGEGVWERGEKERWAEVALRGAGVIR